LGAIARRLNVTVPQVVFRFAASIGMLPLTGTSDPVHAREDLASAELDLGPDDVAAVETVGERW
jgi:diketogulonate reductase-like aldo/keto reductase